MVNTVSIWKWLRWDVVSQTWQDRGSFRQNTNATREDFEWFGLGYRYTQGRRAKVHDSMVVRLCSRGYGSLIWFEMSPGLDGYRILLSCTEDFGQIKDCAVATCSPAFVQVVRLGVWI